jgi:hypothetical protein
MELLDSHVAVGRLIDLMPRFRERAGDAAPQRIVIVGDQNPAHCRPSWSGGGRTLGPAEAGHYTEPNN